jgi:hypothetical protein
MLVKTLFACRFVGVLAFGLGISGYRALASPNVTPYQPGGWTDKIVVTRTNGGTVDSSNLLATDTLYIDWCVINSGSSAVNTTFLVDLYIDGVNNQDWSIDSLGVGYYTYVTGYSIGSLSPGTHTIEVVADATDVIPSDDESDNSYTKTITVNPVVSPAPALQTPSKGATGQMTVPWFSWSAVTNAESYRILIATNAADLPSSATATNGGASVVVNAVSPENDFSPTIQLNSVTTYYWEVHAIAGSEDGTWSSVQSFTTEPIPSGLTIVPSFDSSITSDANAATIEATINAAIAVYRQNFSDPVTAYVVFKEMNSGLGQSAWGYVTESYSDYRAALVSHATTSDDAAAIGGLPLASANPVNGNSSVNLHYPLARALGFGGAGSSSSDPDGTVYLNTSIMNLSSFQTDPSKYSMFSTVCHELDEVLAFASALNGLTNGEAAPTGPVYPQDLFRYDQNGNRSFTTSLSAESFFSFDGTNDLAEFNQYEGGDFGDWYSYDVEPFPQVQDAFLYPGVNPVPDVELRILDAIGFTRVIVVSPVAPQISGESVSGGKSSFTLTGTAGTAYVVQGSTNLINWVSLSTNTIPAGGTMLITNAISALPTRFYRAELP